MSSGDDDEQPRCHDEHALLAEWERRNRINIDCHNTAERLFSRLNFAMAVASQSTLVALGVTAASFDVNTGNARYAVVGLGVGAAIASLALTISDFGAKASAHKTAARQYGAICRQIERALLVPSGSDDWALALDDIQRRWDWTAEVAPNVPQRIRDMAVRKPRPRRFV